jgi:hypothetical protein
VQLAPEQNVRDQLVAFAVHAAGRRPDHAGP